MRILRLTLLACAVITATSLVDQAKAQERPDERVVALARALDARLTVWKKPDGTVLHVRHCRAVRQGCRARIVKFSQWMVEVADAQDIDHFLLAAMAIRESGLDPFAAGGVGERGLIQLHPRGVGRRVRFVQSEAYRRHCRHRAGACQREVLEAGGELVAKAIAHCGGVAEGLGAYNTGVCGENDYSRKVLREHEKLLSLAKSSLDRGDTKLVD
jgi:hypothetical protein